MAKGHDSAGAPIGAAAPTETPERWSAPHKTDVVLRLLKGEAIDAVSRDTQVPAHELEEWRRVFLESGTHGDVRARADGDGNSAVSNAGASLTPSPTISTRFPRPLSHRIHDRLGKGPLSPLVSTVAESFIRIIGRPPDYRSAPAIATPS